MPARPPPAGPAPAPMLAVPGRLPPDREPGWAYEFKWDGVRALVTVGPAGVDVRSRIGRDVTRTYPELAGLPAALGRVRALLDGEVVALDAQGRPSFEVLQARMHVVDAAAVPRLTTEVPVAFLAFDVLALDGREMLSLPYARRRELLDRLGLSAPAWQAPPSYPGPGAAVLAASLELGLEGVVAKRLSSPYRPGVRSEDWVKVKNVLRQEVVIGGWRPGEGRRAGLLGSLLLGVGGPDGAGLRYAGHVGTGFSDRMLRELGDRLAPLRRPTTPFGPGEVPRPDARDAVWVQPELVAEVEFTGWTRDGRLRHPSYKGLRADIDPTTVVREGPA